MKKMLMLLLVSSTGLSYAMQTVNLSTKTYKCNGTRITVSTTEATLLANCKSAKVRNAAVVVSAPPEKTAGGGGNAIAVPDVDEDGDNDVNMERVKFYADDGTYMKCYYKDSTLVKCKAKPPKSTSPASASS